MTDGTPPDIPGLVYVQPLGSGGYADVFLYEQQMPRMPVAVKVLKSEGMTPSIRRQFIDEADTMAQLADHPYIVQVFRADTSGDGRPYLVMKYYPPPNLAVRARAERFTVEEVLRTGIQLASAVETAHRAGVIHRDIKPANVLVNQYGAPGLTDFGIAGRGRALEEDQDDEVGVSVPWAPPEVLFGHSNGGSKSDVYSLSATLWQLLVGRSPFEVPGGDNSAYALMPRIRSTPVPSTGRADVPVSLERLLSQSMSKDENARPQTALAFARALQEIEQEQRFPRTGIVVLDEQGHTTVADQHAKPGYEDVDQTRVRAPQSVPNAQLRSPAPQPQMLYPPMSGSTMIPPAPSAPVTSASVGVDLTGDSPTQPPSSLGIPADEGTVRVKRDQPTSAPAQPSGPDGSVTISPLVLLGVIGVLVVGLVVGLIWANRDTPPDPTPPPPATQTLDPGDQLGVPEVPTLTATAQQGSVKFTWTYAGARDNDRFRIRTARDTGDFDEGQILEKTSTTATIKAGKGVQVCGQVLVIREGGVSSAYSSAKCERAR